MRNHNQLKAFQLADELTILIYGITRDFPKEEIYGLTQQIRRAAVSVPSNIVEGCGRESIVEYHRFLDIAYGSLKELHYQCTIADRLGYIKDATMEGLELRFVETEKVLGALLRSLRNLK
jgi:four helix bundle protein